MLPRRQCLALVWLLLALTARAETPPEIVQPTDQDRSYMATQRERIDSLARSDLGRQLRREHRHDLGILQDLLDRRLVRKGQTVELQAMGVIMGDVLAADLDMDWVIYSDKHGRSRALRMGKTDNFLFPITMISRRVEAGAKVDVEAVFEKARSSIEPYRQDLPFQ